MTRTSVYYDDFWDTLVTHEHVGDIYFWYTGKQIYYGNRQNPTYKRYKFIGYM